MSILLDTHAWIWLAAGERRLATHERLLTRAANASELLISAVSVYETALIGVETEDGRRRGRQAVRMRPTVQQWIRDAIAGTRVMVVAVDDEIALRASALQGTHSDPFDRFIAATGLVTGARLATADLKIIAFAESVGLKLLGL